MLTYIISPYNHRDKIVRTARFKAVSDIAREIMLQGESVFCEANYIHAILEANPDLTYDNFDWTKILRPIRKQAERVIAYQLPGWREDNAFVLAYNMFLGWGEDVQVVGTYPQHNLGKYKDVWDTFGIS